jgi:hypothetical protein
LPCSHGSNCSDINSASVRSLAALNLIWQAAQLNHCTKVSAASYTVTIRSDIADWRSALDDARTFLTTWAEQAEALGWTARDLFGLTPAPNQPAANYRRLSRYDLTGLIWLLRGRPVVALTEAAAAIQHRRGSITTYRR